MRKAVELRLRQRVGALQFQGVLGRQDVKRPGQRAPRAGDRHRVLLHRLEQRGLGSRAGAVDLVGHQELAEHGTWYEAELAPPAPRFLQDLRTQNVGRHQVGGALDPLVFETRYRGDGLDKPRLAQPGHADQERVAAGQKGDQRLLHHLILAEDDPADGFPDLGKAVAGALDLGGQFRGVVQGFWRCRCHLLFPAGRVGYTTNHG